MYSGFGTDQFGWLSERGGNFLNFLQKEGVPRKGGGGGSNPGENYAFSDFASHNYTRVDES